MKTNKLILTLALCLLSAVSLLAEAPLENRYRPFVRWWWNGDRVQAEELVRELHLLKEAGIGGVEINPISFPSGSDTLNTKELKWLSDEWIDMLQVVFDEAEKIGMTCDLIIGSGWPFGAESLNRDKRARVLLTLAREVKGGETLEVSKFAIFKELDPGVSVVNPRRTPHLLRALLAPDPINSLDEAIDVTDRFDADGILSVEVPEGKHQFYALVEYDSFACVINGAPGAAGSILDHMNKEAVLKYLNHMTDTIEGRIGPLNKHIRAFFVDSMELEGSNWTSDMAEEFKKRRGYDLMPWLPFTMFKVGRLGNVLDFNYGAKKGEQFANEVNRVRYDFERTKAELLQERFFSVYAQWCREKGIKSRAQAYGCGFFPLESSMNLDIPEGESWTTNWLKHRLGEEMGDEDYRRGRGYTMIDKYVSSAAHLTGKRLVSAEEMTHTYKVFGTSLEFIKLGSDMAAFSGITHSVWHGFNYSPAEAAFPGWVQYGCFHNERNPYWPYFHLLNEYRARMSSLLQNADMYTDIALLPANNDMWSEMGVQQEPFPVKLNIPYTSLVWEAIHKNGGGADYVSEDIIKDATVSPDGKLCYGPKRYSVLFLIEVSSIMQESLDKLEEFVAKGGRVFCIAKAPEKSLGLMDYVARDEQVRASVERLKATGRFIVLDKPADNKFLEWYKDVMEQYNLPHTVTIGQPDRFLLQNRYVMDNKENFFFFANANLHEPRETDLSFPKSIWAGRKPVIFNPADGLSYDIPVVKGQYHLALGPAETVLIRFGRKAAGRAWAPAPVAGADSLCVKGWKVELRNPQDSVEVHYLDLDELKDIKDIKEYKHFYGTVTYKTTVSLDGPSLPKYLNLGKVCEIADVKVNGQSAGVSWFGRRILDVSKLLHPGDNTIEIKVSTLMVNYMYTLKDNKVAQRYVIRREQPMASLGLLGPVKLY